DLARRIAEMLPGGAHLDETRGFDHGCWGVLLPIYPDAQVPVVQLSLDRRLPLLRHYELARSLRSLRQESILFVGSGNIVHNLARIDFTASKGAPWAVRCNDRVKQYIADNDVPSLANFALSDPDALLSIPTPEHFLPLLYVLGVRGPDDRIQWFNDTTTMGSLSMTSLVLAS
ncbi:MAG: dioxygenase, partial [Bryobacterales bacterium]|nr:dioxygenase [Bryobacterales bacterium]